MDEEKNIDKDKVSVYIEGQKRNIGIRSELWEVFGEAIEKDRLARFSNKSDAVRYFITKFIEEVGKQRGNK